jgi:hypothetical protein
MMHRDLIFGQAALAYITSVLEPGNALCRALLTNVNFKAGTISGFVPDEIRVATVSDFKMDRGLRRNVSLDHLAAVIKCALADDKVAILENRYAHRMDPWLKTCRSRLLPVGEEVYHVLTDEDLMDRIHSTIVEADTAGLLVGIICHLSGGFDALSQTVLGAADFDSLVGRTSLLIVEAFDGGGFLEWRPGLSK